MVHWQVAYLLAAGYSPDQAAERLKDEGSTVTGRTIRNWLKDPALEQVFEEASNEVLTLTRSQAVKGALRTREERLHEIEELFRLTKSAALQAAVKDRAALARVALAAIEQARAETGGSDEGDKPILLDLVADFSADGEPQDPSGEAYSGL